MRSTRTLLTMATVLMLTTVGLRTVHGEGAETEQRQPHALCLMGQGPCPNLVPTPASPAPAPATPAPPFDETDLPCSLVEHDKQKSDRSGTPVLHQDLLTACHAWKAYKDQAGPTDRLCASVEHPKEIGTAAAMEADRLWKTSGCADWKQRKEQVRQLGSWYSGGSRVTSTIDCLTTWDDGRYSSRLTTTCTSY